MATIVRVHYHMVNAGPIRQDMGCLRWPKLRSDMMSLEPGEVCHMAPGARKADAIVIQTSDPVQFEISAGPELVDFSDASPTLPEGTTILSFAEGWRITFRAME